MCTTCPLVLFLTRCLRTPGTSSKRWPGHRGEERRRGWVEMRALSTLFKNFSTVCRSHTAHKFKILQIIHSLLQTASVACSEQDVSPWGQISAHWVTEDQSTLCFCSCRPTAASRVTHSGSPPATERDVHRDTHLWCYKIKDQWTLWLACYDDIKLIFKYRKQQNPLCLTVITTCKSYVTKSEAVEGPHRRFTSLSGNQEVLVDQKQTKKLILSSFLLYLHRLSNSYWADPLPSGSMMCSLVCEWSLGQTLELNGPWVAWSSWRKRRVCGGRWVGSGTAIWLRDALAAQTGM